MSFTAYILECSDGSLYAGCTNNLEKRLKEHNAGKAGAKYTRGRRPVVLVYQENFKTLAKGRKREAEFKRLTREEKIMLISVQYENAKIKNNSSVHCKLSRKDAVDIK